MQRRDFDCGALSDEAAWSKPFDCASFDCASFDYASFDYAQDRQDRQNGLWDRHHLAKGRVEDLQVVTVGADAPTGLLPGAAS